MLFRSFIAPALAICLSLSLLACGGGGSDGDPGSGLSITSNSLSFTAVQRGSTPATQDVGLSFTTPKAVYAGAAYGPGVTPANWIDVTVSGSGKNYTFHFRIIDTSLSPGTYSTTIGLGIADGNRNIVDYKNVNVSYTVLALPTVSSSVVNYFVSEGATPEQQSVILAASGSQSWNSSVIYTEGTSGWLTVSPNSGDTFPQAITFNAAYMPLGIYKANVTVSVSGSPISIPVSLAVNNIGVNFVTPYIATANVAGEVAIRGYGFYSVANPEVIFGGQSATAIDVISDTEIRAGYPALAQGNYSVSVQNASQMLPTRAELVVVDATAFTYTVIPRINADSGGIASHNLVFDAERKSIYVLEIGLGVDKVEMYRFNGGSWDTASIPTNGSSNLNSHIVLTPDGSELLKSNYSAIAHINTDSFTVVETVSAAAPLGNARLNMLSMTNDGGAIGNFNSFSNSLSLYKYDVLTKRYYPLATPSDFNNRQITSPANGSKAIVTHFTYGTADTQFMYEYDAGTGKLVETQLATLRPSIISFDATGNRLIMPEAETRNVYDGQYNLLGALPGFDSVVTSPDGTKAYTYVSSTNSIHVYDLNIANAGEFVEIGTGTILPDVGGGAMAVSSDGNTLIMAGSQNIIVIPVP